MDSNMAKTVENETNAANIPCESSEDFEIPQNIDSTEFDTNSEGTYKKAAPKKLKFYVDYEKWKALPIKCNRRGDRRLGGEWSKVLADAMSELIPECPLVLKWNHVKKAASRKKHSYYFTSLACCKFPGCLKYKITLKKEPTDEGPVKVKARLASKVNEIRHHIGLKKGRPITGTMRKEIADELNLKGPSKLYYEKLGAVPQEAYDAGNTSEFGSKQVFQKISSECALANKLHSDVIAEVVLLKHVYEKEDEGNAKMKGCIRSVSVIPFSVCIYTADQLSLLAEQIQNKNAILHFDATGKVVSNIPSQDKRVYYYALLLKGQQQGDPPVPVAEMISNSHNTTDITSFFLKLTRDLHQVFPNAGIPQRIEIDYSWAFLHGILLAFNHEDVASYLQRSWKMMNGTQDWGSHIKLHICSAHLLHKISGKLKTSIPRKEVRKYILFVVARMAEARSLLEIDTAFRNLCILLLSENAASHPGFQKAYDELDDVIAHQSLDVEEQHDIIKRGTDFMDEEIGSTPKQSAFAHHFNKIIEDVKSSLKMPKGSHARNDYYCPDIVTYLLNTYMSIVPFWTGFLLEGEKRHDTNSSAENWMRILKKDILQGKTRLSPANFIIEVRSNMKGRIREYRYKLEQGTTTESKPGHRKRTKSKKSSPTFTESEEKWEKKQKTNSLYFSSPSKIPKPKSRLKINKKKSMKEEAGLHWGGKVRIGDRMINLSNTCPVDNLLMMMHLLLKRDDIRIWFQQHQNDLKVTGVLLEIDSLFQSGNWTDGRALWLSRFLQVPCEDTWDIWGSEAEKFVIHFAKIQETECLSICSKRLCPEKQRCLKSTEILLGDSNEDQSHVNLQNSLDEWTNMPPSKCVAGTAHGKCTGTRTCTKRRFLYDPPIIIVSVSYLSQARSMDATELPSSVNVADRRYHLFGYTLNTHGHFKCYYQTNGSWFQYDGLRVPEISPVNGNRNDGIMEHVVFIRKAETGNFVQ